MVHGRSTTAVQAVHNERSAGEDGSRLEPLDVELGAAVLGAVLDDCMRVLELHPVDGPG
jgi:hypothetical protein